MSEDSLVSHSLGWDIADSASALSGASSALFVVVAALYWSSTWLIRGLPPLVHVASWYGRGRSENPLRRLPPT